MGDDMSLLTVLRLTSVPHTSCVLMIMVGRAALMSESAGRRIPVSQRPSQMGGGRDVMQITLKKHDITLGVLTSHVRFHREFAVAAKS